MPRPTLIATCGRFCSISRRIFPTQYVARIPAAMNIRIPVRIAKATLDTAFYDCAL
jgi:hypothetical protein